MRTRPWEPEDTFTVLDWIKKDPSLLADLGLEGASEPEVITAITEAFGSYPSWVLGVVEDDEGEAVAVVALNVVFNVYSHQWVNPEKRGKGFWAGKSALNYVFNEFEVPTQLGPLNVNTLIGVVSKKNRAAYRINKKLGFVDSDDHVMVLTKARFNNQYGKTEDPEEVKEAVSLGHGS